MKYAAAFTVFCLTISAAYAFEIQEDRWFQVEEKVKEAAVMLEGINRNKENSIRIAGSEKVNSAVIAFPRTSKVGNLDPNQLNALVFMRNHITGDWSSPAFTTVLSPEIHEKTSMNQGSWIGLSNNAYFDRDQNLVVGEYSAFRTGDVSGTVSVIHIVAPVHKENNSIYYLHNVAASDIFEKKVLAPTRTIERIKAGLNLLLYGTVPGEAAVQSQISVVQRVPAEGIRTQILRPAGNRQYTIEQAQLQNVSVVYQPVVKKNISGFHIMEKGDTLIGLSRKYYGHPDGWRKILDANRDTIRNPNSISVGQKLVIPTE